ncbi:hypothetical protein [Geobacter sp. SVR]|uniref:hypothetical protein n=1 Tax=Geobacter sp. SVR TaxID=2495594 RepID=UPI00143F007C|nr:hypothetical protein [Geobacter sp. SVR]BCS53290.1 hypothetical protein GSVR_15980 [Geobacter sp. SVR]GCF85584.1 hypothetical protein GSbR_21840 [Geobacter sp. SVR]
MSTKTYPIQEHVHTINGVSGRMHTVHAPQEVRGNLVHRNQRWISEGRPIKGYGTNGVMHVNIRFDDECKNGHQSFSITADVYTAESRRQKDIAAGGCLHEEIARVFPELEPLVKWHLVSTDGPMHYIANTLYHAGDRDCHGLRKGESQQIRNGKTGQLCWQLVFTGEKPPQYVDSDTEPEAPKGGYKWMPWCRIGEGKERNLEAARESACWPEATNEQLRMEPEDLKKILEARLSALLAEFKTDMERIGFLWEPLD